MNETITICTQLGTIVAYPTTDKEHPGVWLDLRRPGCPVDMPLALVEYTADDAEFPDGEPHLITRIWGDGTDESYTERVVHERIEDFFRLAAEEQG